MTQQNKLFTYGFRWDSKLTVQRVAMRILSFDVESMLETSHHTIFIEKNGKKRPYNFECAKGALFGERRNEVHCPACATDRYPKQRGEKYMWFLDLEDIDTATNQPKLKWTTISYSLSQELTNYANYYGQGKPLFQLPLVLERQRAVKKTTYLVRNIPNAPQVDTFDLNAWLLSNNLTELPPIVGDKSVFPPIIKVTAAELQAVAQGQLPWGATQAQPVVQPQAYAQPFVGQAQTPYGQPVQPAYQQPMQPAYAQPVQQPVYAQPAQPQMAYQQPAPQMTQPAAAPINMAAPVAQGQAVDTGAFNPANLAVEVSDIDSMKQVVDNATPTAVNPVPTTKPIF